MDQIDEVDGGECQRGEKQRVDENVAGRELRARARDGGVKSTSAKAESALSTSLFAQPASLSAFWISVRDRPAASASCTNRVTGSEEAMFPFGLSEFGGSQALFLHEEARRKYIVFQLAPMMVANLYL